MRITVGPLMGCHCFALGQSFTILHFSCFIKKKIAVPLDGYVTK